MLDWCSVFQWCKSVRICRFFGPHLSRFELNIIYRVNLRIQSKSRKIRTRKTLNKNFLHSAFNSSSIFFDDQFHVDFLFYLVLVFTALGNSNNFCFWKFNKLATLLLSLLMSMCDLKWFQPRGSPVLHVLCICVINSWHLSDNSK